ncbi:MAG TPA: phosphoadenylyl-sulfate reductase [Vicinamibacterales bacterium]
MNAALEAVARQMETWSPEEILAWSTAQFSRVLLATGFGAEGCVLIDMAARHQLPVEFFTLDTGLLFPETYELWRRLESKYAITIRGVRPALSVEAQAVAHGDALWLRDPDRCCAIRKVEPLARVLRGADAWITAIRRDQTATRASARHLEPDPKHGIWKVNPLLRWTADDVRAYVRAHDVPVNPLHDAGYPSIGCQPCTTPVRPGEDPRAGRWRHRQEKNECGLHIRDGQVVRASGQGSEAGDREPGAGQEAEVGGRESAARR